MIEDQDIPHGLNAQTYAALPIERQIELTVALLKRGDLQAIENLGIKIVDSSELANEPPQVIRIDPVN